MTEMAGSSIPEEVSSITLIKIREQSGRRINRQMLKGSEKKYLEMEGENRLTEN